MDNTSCVIFLYRNPIDIYISKCKTRHTNKWINFDTTNVKIIFNKREYEFLKKDILDYINQCTKYCINHNVPYVNIYYEYFVMLAESEQQVYLQKLFQTASNIDLLNKNIDCDSFLCKKQDKCNNYHHKIINYDEVKEYLDNENTQYDSIIKNIL
jgi:hypothetical protein